MNIEQVISEYFSRQTEVIAVYLFGSYADNKSRCDSDLDLAILCESFCPEKLLGLQNKYFKELSRVVPKNLDIVMLNRAGELLTYEVFRQGRVIFQRNSEKRVAFQSRRISDYLEFAPLMHRMRKGMMKKLREGQAHG
ncbi:MAG: nucleotidyltransferase domain-containing protein [bacterium]